ncbi:MAG: hypothetical protein KAG56_11380 [Sulfurovaceae bacterium]|nr:hypothetical protein [Sulfurovaceae bacterium]
MSKLFKLKEWLTIGETALHLSGVLGEPVEEKDIYRLALDGHLRLSVDFVNHAAASLGEIVGEDKAKYFESTDMIKNYLAGGNKKPEKVMILLSTMLDKGRYINFDNRVVSISGVWDLMMRGCESLDIEHYYQQTIGGPEVTLTMLSGTFVHQGDKIAKIMDDFDNNEYTIGSKARLKTIEENIIKNNLSDNYANKLLEKHKADRKEYLKKRKSSKEENNYYL